MPVLPNVRAASNRSNNTCQQPNRQEKPTKRAASRGAHLHEKCSILRVGKRAAAAADADTHAARKVAKAAAHARPEDGVTGRLLRDE